MKNNRYNFLIGGLVFGLISVSLTSFAARITDPDYIIDKKVPNMKGIITSFITPGLYLGTTTNAGEPCEVTLSTDEDGSNYVNVSIKNMNDFEQEIQKKTIDVERTSEATFAVDNLKYQPLKTHVFTSKLLAVSNTKALISSQRNLGGDGKSVLKIEKLSDKHLLIEVSEKINNSSSGFRKISCDLIR